MLRRAGLLYRHRLEPFSVLGQYPHRASLLFLSCRWVTSAFVGKLSTQLPPRQPSLQPATPGESTAPPKKNKKKKPFTAIVRFLKNLLSQTEENPIIAKKIEASPKTLQYLLFNERAWQIPEGLASTSIPLYSVRFLSVAHIIGCKYGFNSYEAVCSCLAKIRRWHGVLAAVSLAKKHHGRLTSRLLNWRTRALVEVENYTELEGILQEFGEQNVVPTLRTYHLILSGHIRNRDLYKAKMCLVAMTKAGLQPDASTHALVATHYQRLGLDLNVEARSLQSLAEVKATTATSVLNSLIKNHVNHHDLSRALQLLTMFSESKITGVLTVMSEEVHLRDADTPQIILNHPLKNTLIPNATTYSIFIDYLAKRSNINAAFQISRNMLSAGIEPTPDTVTSLVNIFFTAGHGDLAVSMIKKMSIANRAPAFLFDRILSSETPYEATWAISERLLTIRVLNALLKGILSTHGVDHMEDILNIMKANHIEPGSTTLEIIIAHLAKVESCPPGLLLHVLRTFSSHNVQPTLRHMHIIFSAALRHEKLKIHGRGWNVPAARYSSHRTYNVRPYAQDRISDTSDCFDPTAGLRLPTAPGHRRLLRPSVDSLASRNVLSDSVMIALRIRHEAVINSDLDSAKEIFNILVERGMRPTEHHFTALMEGFTRSGDIDGAIDVMKTAHQMGVKPTRVMFTILIVGHAHLGKPENAFKVFNDMVSLGITPDVSSIDAVVSAFFAVGAYRMARKVLRTLWSYIQAFPSELENMPLKLLARKFRSLNPRNKRNKPLPKARSLELHFILLRLKELWDEVSTMQIKEADSKNKRGRRGVD